MIRFVIKKSYSKTSTSTADKFVVIEYEFLSHPLLTPPPLGT